MKYKQIWTVDTFVVDSEFQCKYCHKFFNKDEAVFTNDNKEDLCCDCVADLMNQMEAMSRLTIHDLKNIIGTNTKDGNRITMTQEQIDLVWNVIDKLDKFRDVPTEGNETS